MSDKTSDENDQAIKTSDKLLNCPLCGSLSGLCITDTREYIRAYTGKIQCSECDLMLQMTLNDVSELRTSLVKAWNTRVPMERILERLEEESVLAEKEMDRAREQNPLQYERCDSYICAIDNAIEIVKEEGGIE